MTRKELNLDGRTGLVYHAARPSTHRILFLHGAGEFGHGITALFRHPGLPSLLEDGMELDTDVIIPCGPATGTWEPDWLDGFLEAAETCFTLKTGKYHLMGYSRGCAGTYRYAARRPGRVASIVALAGKKSLELVPALSHIPVLLIHGEHDDRIPFSDSMEMYEALNAAGCAVDMITDSGDHYISSVIFARQDVYHWQHGAERHHRARLNGDKP